MFKLVAIYRKPTDVDKFESHYREIHTPLVKKIPGLKKLEITHFTGSPGGDARYHMMAEMYFEDGAAMKAGLGSDEGKAAAKDVMSFAGDILHMMFGDAEEK